MLKMFFTLLIHFGFPLGFIFLAMRRNYPDKFDWLLLQCFTGATVGLLYMAGFWHLFGRYWRLVLVILFIGSLVISWRNLHDKPLWTAKSPRDKFGIGFIGFMSVCITAVLAWSIAGQKYNGTAIPLQWPLASAGKYHVVEGGDAHVINSLHAYPEIARKYTVDIVKLNSWGVHAGGLLQESLAEFEIYDVPVAAPIGGRVIEALDSYADTLGGTADTAMAAIYGNRITLRQDSLLVTLAFLRQGSLTVTAGDSVSAGDIIGRVGCSGEASLPLLRIFCYLDYDNPPWGWGVGKPMLLKGRFPTRNQVIYIRESDIVK